MVLELGVGLAFALIGVFLAHWLGDPDKLPEWLTRLSSKPQFRSEVYCVWKSGRASNAPWVCDRVRVRKFLGRVAMRVVEPGDVFRWKIVCDVSKPYLVGKWRSLNDDASARGAIMLKISPQGDIWAGYALGTAREDKIFPQAAVIARSKEEAWKLRNRLEELI